MLTGHDTLAVILAVLFGGAIGLEREISGKAAGLRTNVLICLGAAVFTVISKQMAAGTNASVTRIAAQVVTGVGFLGAGAIIVDRGGIYGLTTAATIWLVASIGVACGARLYALAALATFIALIVLLGLAQLERPLQRYGKKHKRQSPDGRQRQADES
ncbi:MAG TPA: MgtC/SapB family protein [Sedimentisphaerales bacterium]|nr:MgtC/SapB family protein [Sedimentisphaerales bacterium]